MKIMVRWKKCPTHPTGMNENNGAVGMVLDTPTDWLGVVILGEGDCFNLLFRSRND
jgi:hypothetical protein